VKDDDYHTMGIERLSMEEMFRGVTHKFTLALIATGSIYLLFVMSSSGERTVDNIPLANSKLDHH